MTKHHPSKAVELYRDDGAFTVLVDSEGYDREDVEVSWHDGRLHVVAEHLREDGRTRMFHRHLGLPKRIDVEAITAHFDEGVLEVSLPILGACEPDGRVIAVE